MATKSRLLVADQIFLQRANADKPDLVSVFPGVCDDGAYRASYDELKKRGAIQSIFYDRTLQELVQIAGRLTNAPETALRTLLRPVLVTLTSLYVDRSIRIVHRLNQEPNNGFKVAKVLPMHEFKRLDRLIDQTSFNWHFNQALIERIAVFLDVKKEIYLELHEYPEYPFRSSQKNLLSAPPPADAAIGRFIGKISNRLMTHLRKVPSYSARYSSLGFSGDDFYLTKNNFYGPFGIFESEKEFHCAEVERDCDLRAELLRNLNVCFPSAVKELFQEVGSGVLSIETCARLGESFPEFFAEYIPLNFFEALGTNLNRALTNRKTSSVRHLIGTAMTNDEAYFLAAATKILGGQVIGAQHGGHYGYIEDMSPFAEFEYNLYDKIITWGWTDFDDSLPVSIALTLPSPRLSSLSFKKNRAQIEQITKKSQPVILLMTNFLRRFSYISTCGATRVDFNNEILSSQKRLIKGLADAAIRVDHKPYSQGVVDLASDHFAELDKLGGKNYCLLESKQKGLSSDLIGNYEMILWDQIGTGALDCFVSKIPTMVYWDRIYSRESKFARPIISELERVGVVHSSLDSLINETIQMLKDPCDWMRDRDRQSAVNTFCDRFARTDKNWPTLWRRTLCELDKS